MKSMLFLIFCLFVLGPIASMHAASDEPPTSLASRLDGAWRQQDGRILGFSGDRCISSFESRQSVFRVDYAEQSITRSPFNSGPTLTETVSIVGDSLTLTYPGGNQVTHTRLAEVPDAVTIAPFPLGSRVSDESERNTIRAEMIERGKRDQAVRVRMNERMQAAQAEGKLSSPSDYQAFMKGEGMATISAEMNETDKANTEYVRTLMRDVGWIDIERFGIKANDAAFLIVQHCGSLSLMQTALPLIEAQAKTNARTDQNYALMYDRSQLALGGMQRYGSQLTPGPDGTLHVRKLENPDQVDERRRELGMLPLETYLNLFRQSGQKVVVD